MWKNLGTVFESRGEYVNTYLDEVLPVSMEIDADRDGEAKCYGKLGILFLFLGEYVMAKEG